MLCLHLLITKIIARIENSFVFMHDTDIVWLFILAFYYNMCYSKMYTSIIQTVCGGNMASFTNVETGLTFDDVLLVPGYSEVLPRDVSTRTRLTRNISLTIPIVSAAMDTVTEAKLAIGMAREGGIGIIHKNMTIQQQVLEVRKVKRADNGLILDPYTVHPETTLAEVLQLMHDNSITGVPVVTHDMLLVGILTNRDLRNQDNPKILVKDIMTKENLVTARLSDVPNATSILSKHKIEKLPIVDAEGKLIGLLTYKDVAKIQDNPNAVKDAQGRLCVCAGIGVTQDSLERVEALVQAGVDAICIDTAHAHSVGVISLLKEIKNIYPYLDVIVGNIATAHAARMLVDAGADAVKVGIGPGSICTTRIIAGVGVPQLQAISNVYQEIRNDAIPIIADGGIRYSGDIVKALAAGADAVMIGSLLAGVEEAPGETIIFNGRSFKSYRGMGSLEAMVAGSKDRYFQDAEDHMKKLVPEGIVAKVPYKGLLADVLYQLVGGIRSGMGYCGAPDVVALRNAEFVRVSPAGMVESHPHDVTITQEAPNYSRY